jgi:hypothetical protein
MHSHDRGHDGDDEDDWEPRLRKAQHPVRRNAFTAAAVPRASTTSSGPKEKPRATRPVAGGDATLKRFVSALVAGQSLARKEGSLVKQEIETIAQTLEDGSGAGDGPRTSAPQQSQPGRYYAASARDSVPYLLFERMAREHLKAEQEHARQIEELKAESRTTLAERDKEAAELCESLHMTKRLLLLTETNLGKLKQEHTNAFEELQDAKAAAQRQAEQHAALIAEKQCTDELLASARSEIETLRRKILTLEAKLEVATKEPSPRVEIDVALSTELR